MNATALAKQIKAELTAFYPGEKFSVRQAHSNTHYAFNVEHREGLDTKGAYEIARYFIGLYDVFINIQRAY